MFEAFGALSPIKKVRDSLINGGHTQIYPASHKCPAILSEEQNEIILRFPEEVRQYYDHEIKNKSIIWCRLVRDLSKLHVHIAFTTLHAQDP